MLTLDSGIIRFDDGTVIDIGTSHETLSDLRKAIYLGVYEAKLVTEKTSSRAYMSGALLLGLQDASSLRRQVDKE